MSKNFDDVRKPKRLSYCYFKLRNTPSVVQWFPWLLRRISVTILPSYCYWLTNDGTCSTPGMIEPRPRQLIYSSMYNYYWNLTVSKASAPFAQHEAYVDGSTQLLI